MTSTDLRQQEFNKFAYISQVPYLLVKYLMDNDEIIWKLLKNNDAGAWNSSNLTTAEKATLIYDGVKDQTSCRVFLDYGQDEAWTDQISILRISVLEATPTNYVWGNLTIGCEVYSHYQINQLSNYQSRIMMISQRLIEVFNGADIGTGVGRLYFDYPKGRSKLRIIGTAPFRGAGLTFCNFAFG